MGYILELGNGPSGKYDPASGVIRMTPESVITNSGAEARETRQKREMTKRLIEIVIGGGY